jgi:hypothetical protein
LREGELQMTFQQRPDIGLARVVRGDLRVSHHAGKLRDRYFSAVNR